MAAIPLKHEVHYPESDGRPMGETDLHITEIMELILLLRERYRNAADVYIGGDMLLYYVEGDPNRRVCPDVFNAARCADTVTMSACNATVSACNEAVGAEDALSYATGVAIEGNNASPSACCEAQAVRDVIPDQPSSGSRPVILRNAST